MEESIYQDSIINEALNTLKDTKIYYKDASLIIDELETLTVIDVNTSGIKSNQKKEVFFEDINRKILEPLAYNLKFRNIGGMVVIDFLRVEKKQDLEEEFKNILDFYGLEYEIHGFTNMGLFELTLKRRGESLTRLLKKRHII